MNPIVRRCLLSVAGLAAAGSAVAGPTAAAHAAPTPVKGKGDRSADYEYQAQPNFFYCGPASARIALSAEGKDVSQDELAAKLGTTESGTDSAIDVTRVLNEYTGGKYKTTEIRDDVATPGQVERLRADVRAAVDADRPVVANILGGARDVDGVEHYYPGHYLTVVRYQDDGNTVLIADPARPDEPTYWMSVTELANWIAGRGYSS
ncbi:C39 family peptidase [Micromonospora sp. WMMC241]|uniref:C39 family peptidase n=1 Tax=Micromonospora sp. WMMC241 TaxID=3015159 RepID=UPI0022B74EA0|nr:C39 family peptidase [Micromonospora sp. WMMC241]MCZ7440113.1 C39 family peptidase [Micromonospora sp. WMMC241]